MFINISLNSDIHLIQIVSEHLNLEELNSAIQKEFGISESFDCTKLGIKIPREKVVDYISQYIINPEFVLFITVSQLSLANVTPVFQALDQVNECSNEIEVLNQSPQRIALDLPIISTPELCDFIRLTSNDARSSTTIKFDKKENLLNILKSGANIALKKYENNKKLEQSDRIHISKTIIKTNHNPERTLSRIDFEILAENLIQIFPTEETETYFIRSKASILARGKLWDAYNNYRTKLAEAGLIQRRSKSRTPQPNRRESGSTVSSFCSTILSLDGDECLTNDLEDLKTLTSPFESVERKWIATLNSRQQMLKTNISTGEYLNTFPALSQGDGYKLIIKDTELLYEKLEYKLSVETFQIILQMSKKNKNPKLKNVLQNLEKEITEQSKSVYILLILAYLMPICNISRGRAFSRPSKIEALESFIRCYDSLSEADKKQKEYIVTTLKIKAPVQPNLVFIGTPVELAIIQVAHIKYRFTDIKEALEAYFSVFLALNIEYPEESRKIYYFIQKYILKINTPYDTINVDSSCKTFARDLLLLS